MNAGVPASASREEDGLPVTGGGGERRGDGGVVGVGWGGGRRVREESKIEDRGGKGGERHKTKAQWCGRA